MKVVFAEADKMFSLTAEALAPSPAGSKFLREFFLTESADPVALIEGWAAKKRIPRDIAVVICADESELAQHIGDADVVITEKQALTEDLIIRARRLRQIQLFGLIDSIIDKEVCASRGIRVALLDRHTNRMVAEHCIMTMLALVRRLDAQRAAVSEPSSLPPGAWAYNWPASRGVRGLAQCTIGLVGFGEIAQVLARLLRSFGANVIYTRRNRDLSAEASTGAHFVDLETLVAKADIVSIHVPGTAENKFLFGAERLARMKPGSILINTSRGSVVDESALVRELGEGRIGAAGLDVFAVEPLAADHPLQRLPNVILTPHVAAGTRDENWLELEIGPLVDAVLEINSETGTKTRNMEDSKCVDESS